MAGEESIPLSFLLEFAKGYPDHREVLVLEQLIAHYFLQQGKQEVGYKAINELRRHFMPADRVVAANRAYDSEVVEVLKQLTDEGIISMQVQFVAVYRVLVDFFSFPAEYTSFCRRIVDMGVRFMGKTLEYESLYQSVQKGIQSHPLLISPYKKWQEYKPVRNDRAVTFNRQKLVADSMVAKLKARNLLQTK